MYIVEENGEKHLIDETQVNYKNDHKIICSIVNNRCITEKSVYYASGGNVIRDEAEIAKSILEME